MNSPSGLISTVLPKSKFALSLVASSWGGKISSSSFQLKVSFVLL